MNHTPHTIAQALAWAHAQGLARIDAQLLLLHALARPDAGRAWLLAHDTDVLDAGVDGAFTALCQRRATGEPVAYLTGHKEFYGLALQVDARVLDPRPDTETLVDWALEVIAARPAHHGVPHIVDLGTGSGAIALALQHQCPSAKVWAVDASADALAVAQANATRLNLPVQFVRGNWLAGLCGLPSAEVTVTEVAQRDDGGNGHGGQCGNSSNHTSHSSYSGPSLFDPHIDTRGERPEQGYSGYSGPSLFDLIVSNPPYIAAQDPHLAALTHEPLQALASGPDGLDDIRTIVAQAPAHLRPGGWLLLEHGHDQSIAVQTLLQASGFTHIQSRNDLAGIARCTGGQWPLVQTVK